MKAKIRSTLFASLTPAKKPFDVFDADLPGLILRVQPTGLMTYFCACRTKSGLRRRIRLGATTVLTPAQARDEARKILGDIARGADPQAELLSKRKKESEMILGVFLDTTYGPWAEQHLTDASNALRRLKACFKSLLGKKLSALDGWAFEAWKAQRRKSGTQPSTINRDLAGLRSALSRAVDWGLLPAHPMQKVKPIRAAENIRVRYLSDDEERHLRQQIEVRQDRLRSARESGNAWRRERGYDLYPSLEAVQTVDHLKPMILMSLNTGLRRGELFALQWSDIDWQALVLTVRGANSKSKKSRAVPMNEEVRVVLSSWRQASGGRTGLIFPSAQGARRDNSKRAWGKLLEDAEISGFRWHDMRHHFASRLVMEGVDLNTVRELLGHADLKMTLRYAHLAPEHKAAAVAKLVRNLDPTSDKYAEAA